MSNTIKWWSVCFALAASLMHAAQPPSCVMNAKDSTFAMLALNQKMPVLIYFTDPRQPDCVAMDTLIEEVAIEYASEVRFIRVDSVRCPRITKASKVTRVPYFCLFNRPSRLTFNFTGILDKGNLRRLIDRGINPQSIAESANSKYAAQDYKGAIEDYTLALQMNPKDGAMYNARANARHAARDYKGALVDYTVAIKYNPENPEFYSNRGNLKNSRDDLDGAIADFSEALRLRPTDAEDWNNRGCAKSKRGDYPGAIEDFTRAIACNSEFTAAYRNRGMTKLVGDDSTGAMPDFQKTLQSDKSMEASLDLWLARSRRENRASANQELAAFFNQNQSRRALSDDCTKTIGEFLMGKLSTQTLLERVENLETSWAKGMLTCTAYYYMGQEKLSAKKTEEATSFFRKAVATGETSLATYNASMAELAKIRPVASASPAASASNEDAPLLTSSSLPITSVAQKQASDFFRLGEMLELTCLRNFFSVNGNRRDHHLEEMHDLAASLDAPPAVLADIERIRKINVALPFSTPLKNWLSEEKKLAASSTPNPTVWNQWLINKGDDKYLYSWLGRFSLRAWLGVQKNIIVQREPIASELKNMQSIVNGAEMILTDPRYETLLSRLTNETFAALNQMDATKSVIDSSGNELPSLSVVNAIGNAGKKLYLLNKEGKLVKD